MATIIFGLVVLALALWALNAFTKVNPQTAAVVLKTGGGLGALAAAGLLGVRGRLDIAIPLGLTGLGLLGWLPWSMPGFAARTQKSAGQVSRVRSAFMEMELDHDTGAMRGRILAGRHEGAALDALDVATLTGFLPEIDEAASPLPSPDEPSPAWTEPDVSPVTPGPTCDRVSKESTNSAMIRKMRHGSSLMKVTFVSSFMGGKIVEEFMIYD